MHVSARYLYIINASGNLIQHAKGQTMNVVQLSVPHPVTRVNSLHCPRSCSYLGKARASRKRENSFLSLSLSFFLLSSEMISLFIIILVTSSILFQFFILLVTRFLVSFSYIQAKRLTLIFAIFFCSFAFLCISCLVLLSAGFHFTIHNEILFLSLFIHCRLN